ncbi:hypothetical protein BU16DRAFT_566525 [Lophium mytilinum]|uniref:Uncharacterized protein n=1 Tax=Lophium mytilinum TaxID=390894 RepID=A0A6A6QEH0_9PEZI|nr:hypothetical protein BU16DRAFT_566525 [Lophium mytilinum]
MALDAPRAPSMPSMPWPAYVEHASTPASSRASTTQRLQCCPRCTLDAASWAQRALVTASGLQTLRSPSAAPGGGCCELSSKAPLSPGGSRHPQLDWHRLSHLPLACLPTGPFVGDQHTRSGPSAEPTACGFARAIPSSAGIVVKPARRTLVAVLASPLQLDMQR